MTSLPRAGKNLTVGELHQGRLRVEERQHPGHRAISFGPGQAYATGPVTIFKYDPTSETLVPATN